MDCQNKVKLFSECPIVLLIISGECLRVCHLITRRRVLYFLIVYDTFQ